MNTLIITEKNIDIFDKIEHELRQKMISIDDMRLVWAQLHAFFTKATAGQIKSYMWNYFRLYTELSWRLLNFCDNEAVVFFFKTQIPLALLMDFNVLGDLAWYSYNKVREEEARTFFNQVKNSFLSSAASLGISQGKEMTMAEVARQIMALNVGASDSIEMAEFRSRIRQIMFAKDNKMIEKYSFASPDDAIDRLITLTNFCLGVKPEHFYYVVQGMVNPERYDQIISSGILEKKDEEMWKIDKKIIDEVLKETEEKYLGENENGTNNNSYVDEKQNVMNKESNDVKMSLINIKNLIDSSFPKDENGQYQDVGAVFERLEELANESNDPTIKEMLYWDEAEGGFKWKE
jgi:hypothetical protein